MNKNRNIKKGVGRSKFFYSLIGSLAGAPLSLMRNFHFKESLIKEETFILMSNHADNFDPAYVVLLTGRHMRFVMSDHLMKKISNRLIFSLLASPIVYHRDDGSDVLYKKIVENCQAGVSVGIYVEGGKSNNGETGYISPRNAQLVKDCGCSLVTCRLKGGYLKSPRWADHKRKGPLFGEIVNVFSKEEIKNMTADELYRHIVSDLYVNSYEEQRKNPHKYIGENPAQSAEIMLYVCPKCRQIGTLKTFGRDIFCDCGFNAKVDDYGFWHGEEMKFDDIVSWDKFQKVVVKELVENIKDRKELLFSDEHQMFYQLERNSKKLLYDECVMSLYGNRLEIKTDNTSLIIPLNEIKRVGTASKMNLFFITPAGYYEVKSHVPRSAMKYKVAIRYLQGKDND